MPPRGPPGGWPASLALHPTWLAPEQPTSSLTSPHSFLPTPAHSPSSPCGLTHAVTPTRLHPCSRHVASRPCSPCLPVICLHRLPAAAYPSPLPHLSACMSFVLPAATHYSGGAGTDLLQPGITWRTGSAARLLALCSVRANQGAPGLFCVLSLPLSVYGPPPLPLFSVCQGQPGACIRAVRLTQV